MNPQTPKVCCLEQQMLDRKRKRGERKGNYEYISIIQFILFSATYGQVGKGLIMKATGPYQNITTFIGVWS